MTFPVSTPQPIGADLPLHEIEDHEARVLSRLLTQFQRKPRLAALLGIFTKPLQELEGVFWDLRLKLTLADATDAQLDMIGRILDEPRGPLDDTDYRAVLAIKILVLKSSGTAPELMTIARTLIGADYIYREIFPAAVFIDLLTVPVFTVALLARFMRRAKAGGVRLDIWQGTSPVRYASSASGGGFGTYSSSASAGGEGDYGGIL